MWVEWFPNKASEERFEKTVRGRKGAFFNKCSSENSKHRHHWSRNPYSTLDHPHHKINSTPYKSMGTINLKRYIHACQKDFDLLCLLFCDLSSGINSYIYLWKWDVTMISDFGILGFPPCVLLLFLELFLCLILFLLCFVCFIACLFAF